jgi:hypothetical protein
MSGFAGSSQQKNLKQEEIMLSERLPSYWKACAVLVVGLAVFIVKEITGRIMEAVVKYIHFSLSITLFKFNVYNSRLSINVL